MALIEDQMTEAYTSDANESIHFKLIRSVDDITDDSCTFHPDMSHQIFGDTEKIFGYMEPRVDMYYLAGNLTTYLNMSFKDKLNGTSPVQAQADNVLKLLSQKIPLGFHTSIDNLCQEVNNDTKFAPFGVLKNTYTITDKEDNNRHFEVYCVDNTDPQISQFLDYHRRLQTFLLFFVDGASYIEDDDEHWLFYVLYERYAQRSTGGWSYATAGYMTVYKFYAYPEHIRPRVSQFLILPPFQRQGHGCHLLQTFYNDTVLLKNVIDITVEDPSEIFQRMRDYVDSRNCAKQLDSFSRQRLMATRYVTKEMRTIAKDKLRLNSRQTRRVYEILRLWYTDRHNPEQWKQFRDVILRRLTALLTKSRTGGVNEPSTSRGICNGNDEQKTTQINEEIDRLVEEYDHVVERLDKHS